MKNKKIKKLLRHTNGLPADERITILIAELLKEHYRHCLSEAIKRGKANAAKKRSF